MADVIRRLHNNRTLCEDFAEVQVLKLEKVQKVEVEAKVEIGPVEDAEQLLLEILERIADYVSPPIPFTSLDQLLAAGKTIEEIFDGPRLANGFIDDEVLRKAERRTALSTSDVIHEIMDVPGVRAVRYIRISAGGTKHEWFLKLEPKLVPRLDVEASKSKIQLDRANVKVDVGDVTAPQPSAPKAPIAPPGEGSLALPPGRDRKVGHYHSIQHHFPALYGIAEMGLPESASPRRRAQAKQLKAYLTFFDQILADSFAQLAHVKDLFSYHGEDPRTYFTQPLADPALGLEGILEDDGADDESEPAADPSHDRKNRFLNHLLARFAEQLTDTSLALFEAGADPEGKLVRAKQAFLQSYPRISSARGTAFDQLRPWDDSRNVSGLEERLRLKLALDPEQLVVVEHVLLRPTEDGDHRQTVPLLAASTAKDPYSLQLSVVLPLPLESARRFIEQTIREETPAHLVATVHWLEAEESPTTPLAGPTWSEFRNAHREWNAELHGPAERHLRLRDTRDRLVDLLGFGETYPLQDVTVVRELQMVPVGTTAKIPIDFGQSDVEYELHDVDGQRLTDDDGNALDPYPYLIDGTGDETVLETPPIEASVIYRIFTRKTRWKQREADQQREAYLHQTVQVTVGIDRELRARIDAPLLDPRIAEPSDTAPRIVDYGDQVDVEILQSQEGVDYSLFHDVDGAEVVLSDQAVPGNLGTIVVSTRPVLEDTEIRIRATRTFGASKDELAVELPLKVRAQPDLAVRVEPSPVIAFEESPELVLAGSQRSASYRLYMRTLSDRDFLYGGETPPDGGDVLTVTVDDEASGQPPDVRVPRPPRPAVWEIPEGFEATGELVRGDGGDLSLPLPALTDDSVVIVQGLKEHPVSAAPDAPKIPSAVQLEPVSLILARPDPAPGLALEIPVAGSSLSGRVDVSGGQPGVFYHFRRGATGAERGQPAYFHQLDEVEASENKGLDQLRLELDFVVTRDTARDPGADLSRVRPLPPRLELGRLPLGIELHVRAVKARTRVAVALEQSAEVPLVPEIRLEQETVDAGTTARIVVVASQVGARYQPFLDGEPVKQARNGNGEDLVFLSDPVSEDTTFEVHITRPGDPGLAVTRIVRLTVTIRSSP